MIDGNRLVEALSFPSHDKRVLDLLKELEIKRPVKDENYNGNSLLEELKEEKGFFTFNENTWTEKQKNEVYGAVDFYLNGIVINQSTNVSLPFGIEWNDSYEEVKSILGKKADFKSENKNKKTKEWLLEDREKKYFFTIDFNKTLNTIRRYRLEPYENGFDYHVEINEE